MGPPQYPQRRLTALQLRAQWRPKMLQLPQKGPMMPLCPQWRPTMPQHLALINRGKGGRRLPLSHKAGRPSRSSLLAKRPFQNHPSSVPCRLHPSSLPCRRLLRSLLCRLRPSSLPCQLRPRSLLCRCRRISLP